MKTTGIADNGPILVTGAAGRLRAVGRTVTSLLLDHGLPVSAMAGRKDDHSAALRAAGAEVVVGNVLEPANVCRVVNHTSDDVSGAPFTACSSGPPRPRPH